MVAGIRFTAQQHRVAVRRRPNLDGPALCHLEAGDEIVATDVFIEEGIEWVRLEKGARATRINGSRKEVLLDLKEDGFVPTEDPVQGNLLRKHTQVMVEERREDGALTKAEIRDVLERSSDPNMSLPLESKYWSRQQLEMFVMSGGVIRFYTYVCIHIYIYIYTHTIYIYIYRPRWCSMPDERLMANTNMGKEEIMRALSQAYR